MVFFPTFWESHVDLSHVAATDAKKKKIMKTVEGVLKCLNYLFYFIQFGLLLINFLIKSLKF